MKKPKPYLSFDLDGTLVELAFTELIWHHGIPALYALKTGLNQEQAQAYVLEEYRKVGDGALEWYDLAYWFRFFDLPGTGGDLLRQYAPAVRVYPEVHEVLGMLHEHFTLIILSNAAQAFIEVEMREGALVTYFAHVFSATSDFRLVKKSPAFYRMICERLHMDPRHLIHVGDHREFDYQIPRSLGITALHLDRKGEQRGPDVLTDLSLLPQVLGRQM
jgi:HAD superfamily hydrolase (TIGR01493 family)